MIGIVHTEYTDGTKTEVKVVQDGRIDEMAAGDSPHAVIRFLDRHFGITNLTQEKVFAIYTDAKLVIRNVQVVGIGGIDKSVCEPRDVLITALHLGSAGIILAHNHVSGDPAPSQEDKDLTGRLKAAADLCGVGLVDHVICGSGGCFSFRQYGVLG